MKEERLDGHSARASQCEDPYPPIVPCHRVVRSDGSLGGYSGVGGIETKRRSESLNMTKRPLRAKILGISGLRMEDSSEAIEDILQHLCRYSSTASNCLSVNHNGRNALTDTCEETPVPIGIGWVCIQESVSMRFMSPNQLKVS